MKNRREERVGQTNRAKMGMMMTIIVYRDCNDIDIQFEDGMVVWHKRYRDFLIGEIAHPTLSTHRSVSPATRIKRIGETNKSNRTGMLMTITEYRGCNDIDVMLADGTLVEHCTYTSFTRGQIAPPEYQETYRLGESNKASNGMMMTIIAYRMCQDIDIQFEDGVIVYHQTYYMFRRGQIKHPTVPALKHMPDVSKIGRTVVAKNKLKATCIAYRNKNDLDAQFDDGAITYHISWEQFRRGNVPYPGVNTRTLAMANKYIGTRFITSSGVGGVITDYHDSSNVDILFDTGIAKNHIKCRDVVLGRVSHPFPYQLNDVIMEKPAYICNDTGNFYCKCTKCSVEDILSIEEIKSHKCIAN